MPIIVKIFLKGLWILCLIVYYLIFLIEGPYSTTLNIELSSNQVTSGAVFQIESDNDTVVSKLFRLKPPNSLNLSFEQEGYDDEIIFVYKMGGVDFISQNSVDFMSNNSFFLDTTNSIANTKSLEQITRFKFRFFLIHFGFILGIAFLFYEYLFEGLRMIHRSIQSKNESS